MRQRRFAAALMGVVMWTFFGASHSLQPYVARHATSASVTSGRWASTVPVAWRDQAMKEVAVAIKGPRLTAFPDAREVIVALGISPSVGCAIQSRPSADLETTRRARPFGSAEQGGALERSAIQT